MYIVLEHDLADALTSCVEAGTSELGNSRRAVLDALAGGSTSDVVVAGKTDPDVTFAVPDAAMDDLRSAFTAGWERMAPDDPRHEAAERVAASLGLSQGPAPR